MAEYPRASPLDRAPRFTASTGSNCAKMEDVLSFVVVGLIHRKLLILNFFCVWWQWFVLRGGDCVGVGVG